MPQAAAAYKGRGGFIIEQPTWYQNPLVPASTALPCSVRQPAESPPGLGDPSTSVTP